MKVTKNWKLPKLIIAQIVNCYKIQNWQVPKIQNCQNWNAILYSTGQINIEGSNGQQNSRSSTSMEKVKKALPTLAAPDIAQMTPFKPSFNWRPGQHRIPGKEFHGSFRGS